MAKTPDSYELTKTWVKRFSAAAQELRNKLSQLHTGDQPHDDVTEELLQLQLAATESMLESLKEEIADYEQVHSADV